MADNVGNLNAKLNLDASSYVEGLKKSQEKTTEYLGKIQGSFSSLGGGNLGSGFGLFSSFSGLTSMVNPITAATVAVGYLVEKFRELGEAGIQNVTAQAKLSTRFEISTGMAGALQIAAERYGHTQENLTTGMSHFERMLGQAQRGSVEARAAFASLGLTGRDLERPGEALQTIITRMRELSAAQREDIAQRIFGRGGQELFSDIARRGELGQIQEQGLASGSIASEEQVGRIRELNKELKETEHRLNELRRIRENQTAETILRIRIIWAQGQAEGEQRSVESGGVLPGWLAGSTPGSSVHGTLEGTGILQQLHDAARPVGAGGAGGAAGAGGPAGAGGTPFNLEYRQQLNEMNTELEKTKKKWDEINERQTKSVATLGMGRQEIERWEIGQEIIKLQNQLNSEAMRQASAEERERFQDRIKLLNEIREQSEAVQREAERFAERKANMNFAEQVSDQNSHILTIEGRTRNTMRTLESAEQQLGLNRPVSLARAFTRDSGAAINQINASMMEGQLGKQSIADRIEAVMQAEAPIREQQARDLAAIRTAIEAGAFGRPVNVN